MPGAGRPSGPVAAGRRGRSRWWRPGGRARGRGRRWPAAGAAGRSAAFRGLAAKSSDSNRRQQFVVGRALCRYVLSRYAPVPPEEWRFKLGSRAKPAIAAPALFWPLWFNLSHTDGVSVCAVTGAGPDIDIDIERIPLARDALEIAEQFFPEAEMNALRLLPAAQRGETFVRIWALKESFVKARETSLADGIGGTASNLARRDHIGITFYEPLHERAQEWRFHLFQLDPGQIVALAVRTQTTKPVSLRVGICLELWHSSSPIRSPRCPSSSSPAWGWSRCGHEFTPTSRGRPAAAGCCGRLPSRRVGAARAARLATASRWPRVRARARRARPVSP